jgi:hypothetical protein
MGPSRTSEGIAVLEDAEKTGAAFVTTLGANTVADLRRMSAEKIVATQFKGLAGIPHSDGSLPVQDGYVIPGDTYELYAAGKQAKIPLLNGYTDDEAVNLIQPVDAEKYAANVRAQYGDLADESCVRRGGCKYTVSWIDFRSGSCPRSPRAQADGRLHERREAAPDCEFDGQLRKQIKRRNTDPARWSSLIDILCRPDDPCPPESARQV